MILTFVLNILEAQSEAAQKPDKSIVQLKVEFKKPVFQPCDLKYPLCLWKWGTCYDIGGCPIGPGFYPSYHCIYDNKNSTIKKGICCQECCYEQECKRPDMYPTYYSTQ